MIQALTRRTTLAGLLGTVLAGGALAPSPADAQAFRSKDVTIMVGYTAGGGTDLLARVIAENLGKHLEGEPNVIVKNMPGAGGLTAANFVYEGARPDGQTLLFTPINVQSQILEVPGVRFDYSRFSVAGVFDFGTEMLFARTDAIPGGLENPADIADAEDVVFAGLRGNDWFAILGAPTLDLMDVDYRYVPGFPGGPGITNAVQQGEAQIGASSMPGYRATVEGPLVEAGEGIALWHFPRRDADGKWVGADDAEGVPNFLDVYREAKGGMPDGDLWEKLTFWLDLRSVASHVLLGPPDMDPEILVALQAAVEEAFADPKMQEALTKAFGSVPRVGDVAAAEEAFAALEKTDPAIVDFWKDYTARLAGNR